MCFVNITNLVGNYVGWLSAAAAAILLVAYSRPLRSYWSLRLGLRLEDVELAPLCPLRKISAVRTSHVAPEEVLVPQKRSQVQRIMFVHEPFMMYNIYNYIMHLFIFTLHYINNLDLWLYDIYIYTYTLSHIYIHLYLHIYIYINIICFQSFCRRIKHLWVLPVLVWLGHVAADPGNKNAARIAGGLTWPNALMQWWCAEKKICLCHIHIYIQYIYIDYTVFGHHDRIRYMFWKDFSS